MLEYIFAKESTQKYPTFLELSQFKAFLGFQRPFAPPGVPLGVVIIFFCKNLYIVFSYIFAKESTQKYPTVLELSQFKWYYGETGN